LALPSVEVLSTLLGPEGVFRGRCQVAGERHLQQLYKRRVHLTTLDPEMNTLYQFWSQEMPNFPHISRFSAHDFIACASLDPHAWRQTGQTRV
jgi:hypothetical protein